LDKNALCSKFSSMSASIFTSPTGQSSDFIAGTGQFPAAPNGVLASFAQGQSPDIGVITIPAAANYDDSANPLRIPTSRGLLVWAKNLQTTPVLAIGPRAGDPGALLLPGTVSLLGTDDDGGMILIGSTGGVVAPFIMTGSTPGLAPNETVELTPFLILQSNHAYNVNVEAVAFGVDSVAGQGAVSFSITTAIAIKDGTTLNPGTNTSNSNPANPGIPWSLTLGVGALPDRLSLTFETNTVGSNAACKVVAFVSLVPVAF
jgi:hypothetical protein